MKHEEADHRLAAGWHVDLEEADALCSAQRKRYIRQEQERLNYAFLHSSTTGNSLVEDSGCSSTSLRGPTDGRLGRRNPKLATFL